MPSNKNKMEYPRVLVEMSEREAMEYYESLGNVFDILVYNDPAVLSLCRLRKRLTESLKCPIDK